MNPTTNTEAGAVADVAAIAVIREQAEQVILSYAHEAMRRDKPHIAGSELQMATAAIEGRIDNGATIQTLWLAAYGQVRA